MPRSHNAPKQPGIYKIVNTVNGNLYIGSSIDIPNRQKQHRYHLRNNSHRNPHLQHAWSLYGEEAFAFETVEVTSSDRETLIEREQHYLDTLEPAYNIKKQATATADSIERAAKISNSLKGKSPSQATRDKIAQAARNISDETRRKMSESASRRRASAETRAKMSAGKLGKPKDPESTRKTQEGKAKNRLAKIALLTAEHDLVVKGSQLKLRKLSPTDVLDIRTSDLTDVLLAAKYSCSPATIRKIRLRQSYRDI